LLTGLAPVLQARRADLTSDLKAGAREGTFHRSGARVAPPRDSGGDVVILLIGAGLFVRSLTKVQSIRLGYDIDPVAMVSLNMRARSSTARGRSRFAADCASEPRTFPAS